MPPSKTTRSSWLGPRDFATTHWSVVCQVGGKDISAARAALEKLCNDYWYPLYAYLRRVGYKPEEAEDLTQGLFASLIERGDLAKVSAAKGKFRSFLLAALKHHLSKEREHNRALKRGGGQVVLSLSAATGESRYEIEPADESSPDKLFERRWALAVLENALGRLEVECQRTGKGALFATLKPALTGDRGRLPYAALGKKLELSEANLKVTVHRLRRRYGEVLRDEIAQTVNNPAEVGAELRHLRSALAL